MSKNNITCELVDRIGLTKGKGSVFGKDAETIMEGIGYSGGEGSVETSYTLSLSVSEIMVVHIKSK